MKNNKFTYLGLFISYFSILLIGIFLKTLHGGPLDDGWTVIREVTTLAMVVILLWLIVQKEHLSLDSIGLGSGNGKETARWSLIIFLFCLLGAVAALGVINLLGSEFGNSEPKIRLSLLTTSLVMVRAAIAEEIFFRGFIIERIRMLSGNKWFAVLMSVIPFSLLHYQQGATGIFISFVLGSILTATYLWKRNLKANIIAHFLIDFIPNVLIPLIAG